MAEQQFPSVTLPALRLMHRDRVQAYATLNHLMAHAERRHGFRVEQRPYASLLAATRTWPGWRMFRNSKIGRTLAAAGPDPDSAGGWCVWLSSEAVAEISSEPATVNAIKNAVHRAVGWRAGHSSAPAPVVLAEYLAERGQ